MFTSAVDRDSTLPSSINGLLPKWRKRAPPSHPLYERAFMPIAALLIAAVGVAWSVERGVAVSLGL